MSLLINTVCFIVNKKEIIQSMFRRARAAKISRQDEFGITFTHSLRNMFSEAFDTSSIANLVIGCSEVIAWS